MKTKETKTNREFPRPFGERFKESYHNCPQGSVVVLCMCGNSFHRKNWEKFKYCSTTCLLRYGKQESQVFKSVKEMFAPAS